MLEAAKALTSRGISVVPTKANKTPNVVAWAEFQKNIPGNDQLATLFAGAVGVGAICGQVSGCLECIDFDVIGAFEKWVGLLKENGYEDLYKKLVVQKTPSGGYHAVYRCPDGVQGNLKLAYEMHETSGFVIKIETRGEGGYFMACPSPGYKMSQGTWGKIPEIDHEERDVLFSCARMLNERVFAEHSERSAPQGIKRPGDEYNQRTDWAEILEPAGWTCAYRRGDEGYWVRPGKTKRQGIGATTNYKGTGLMKVFSSNAWPFEADNTYSKFCAFAEINHGGNMSDAAKELGGKGLGDQPKTQKPLYDNKPGVVANAPDRGKQKWVTMDEIEETMVNWLWENYLAVGEVQMIVGDPGDGKSTIAQAIVTAVTTGAELFGNPIAQGKAVFMSAEQSVNSITKPRFRKMGAKLGSIICPDGVDENDDPIPFVLDKSGIAELREVCLDVRPKIVVIDTVTAYIEASRDFNSANQVREWMRRLAEIARVTPCAVVLIGHLNKNQNAHPLQRVMGSMDFVGASRAVLLVGKDPDDQDTRGLCVIKSNLGPFGEPVGFTLREGEFGWVDGSTLNASKMLQPPSIKAAESNRDKCRAWVKSLFKDSNVVEAPKEEGGKIGGFTTYMVTNVKKELGVASKKDGMSESGWSWTIGEDNVYRGGN